MNLERIQKLLDHIKKSPDEQFDYDNWFSSIGEEKYSKFDQVQSAAINKNKKSICGTAACVAGHAILLFWKTAREDIVKGNSIGYIAQEILDISDETRKYLFMEEQERATKADAIMRLEYLIENGNLTDYPWIKESYYEQSKNPKTA